MKYLELYQKIKTNIFNFADICKFFSKENSHNIKTQLHRFIAKGYIKQIRRGLYCFDAEAIDELLLANILYKPSYISMETALNYYGIIPDVSQAVTSISPTTTKTIKTMFGIFYYAKLTSRLFFGYTSVLAPSGESFNLARREKALLDYFYIRKIARLADLRLNLRQLDVRIYKHYALYYPIWVQKIDLL